MIPALMHLALSQRWLVLTLAGLLVALGVWAFQHQQIDAYPDISGQMVQVITLYPGRAPEEVERQVTIPVENAMLGVPRVETVRSRTIFSRSSSRSLAWAIKKPNRAQSQARPFWTNQHGANSTRICFTRTIYWLRAESRTMERIAGIS